MQKTIVPALVPNSHTVNTVFLLHDAWAWATAASVWRTASAVATPKVRGHYHPRMEGISATRE
jgi:hypothetical protein